MLTISAAVALLFTSCPQEPPKEGQGALAGDVAELARQIERGEDRVTLRETAGGLASQVNASTGVEELITLDGLCREIGLDAQSLDLRRRLVERLAAERDSSDSERLVWESRLGGTLRSKRSDRRGHRAPAQRGRAARGARRPTLST